MLDASRQNTEGEEQTPEMIAQTAKEREKWQKVEESWRTTSQTLALMVVFLLLWGVAYSILPQYAEPTTVIMRLLFLFGGAQLCGILVTFVRLPDMLGMIFWGVLYKNVGWGNFEGYSGFEAVLREMALVNIMILAGLGLDLGALRKLFLPVMQLTFIPTIAEVGVITVGARYLLHMPWIWGVLLGLVVTAVSPNVVVSILLDLKRARLGLNKGIHTLIIATTSCNDVLSIFMFGIILGAIFTAGSLTDQLLQGPIGILIGLTYGYLFGKLVTFLPSDSSSYSVGLQFVMMFLGGALSELGSKVIGYPSAGALGCITIAVVAVVGWKRSKCNNSIEVTMKTDLLWKFLKPVSFSLIGKEVNFAVMDPNIMAYGALVLFLGVSFRLGFGYVSTYGANLTWRERAYVTLSTFPKATVQAALGPVALDLARKLNSQEDISLASNVLMVSVLAIVFTAPLGALLMTKLAPHWLEHSTTCVPPADIVGGDNNV